MQEWSDSIKIAIDVIIACVIIMAMLAVQRVSSNIMKVVDADRAAAVEVQEFRTTAMYKDTIVYPQDIVSVIMENQGTPGVYIHSKASGKPVVAKWTATETTCGYSSASIQQSFSNISCGSNSIIRSSFTCDFTYYADGTLEAYHFYAK